MATAATAASLEQHASPVPFTKSAYGFVRTAPAAAAALNFKSEMNVVPTEAFVLQDNHFVNLPLDINAAFKLPGSVELFKSTYSETNFQWLTTADYEQMLLILPTIHQHCADFEKEGLNPMITLAASVASFADEAKTLVTTLKEQLEIICDPSVSLSDTKGKSARGDAKEVLKILKDNNQNVHKKCQLIQKEDRGNVEALKEMAWATEKYNEALAAGDKTKLQLIQATGMLEVHT
ncbi:hypothetical protein MMC30_005217 [Trapelia coarctata]|nr:hypothetical protein [Trapelia coarctata]